MNRCAPIVCRVRHETNVTPVSVPPCSGHGLVRVGWWHAAGLDDRDRAGGRPGPGLRTGVPAGPEHPGGAARPGRPPLERAATAWQAATGTHLPYLVHDADPLAAVADAWVRRYDEQGPAGELEVAVADTLARWRARTIELPDYYLLLDPEALAPTGRHWYLGLLARSAPARVVPDRV